jgi:hypothetical protein
MKFFKRLENINPHCFPIPMQETKGANGVRHLEPLAGSYMGRSQLKVVYNSCGQILHRGRVEHLLNGKQKYYDPGKLNFWMDEFVKLLSFHTVMLPEEHRVLLVSLMGGPGGSVAVYELEADGPFNVEIKK